MPDATRSANAGTNALRDLRRALGRASLIFGSLAVLTVMVLGHGSERGPRYADADGIDRMVTGTIRTDQRYVVSRSVLQPAGAAPCLLFPDGTRRGNC